MRAGIFTFLLFFLFLAGSQAAVPQAIAQKASPQKTTGPKPGKPAAKPKPGAKSAEEAAKAEKEAAGPLQIIGIRPGLHLDSIQRIIAPLGIHMREVAQDTLTHCFADQSIKIYIVDSIYCRLTYMRMSFLFDGTTLQLRRFTITPRESSIADGKTDDINEVLLLYFGQTWGKPEMSLAPPAYFRWRVGNIETRGFIKRGYPLWVMEG